MHEELEKNEKISKDSGQWVTSDQLKVSTTEFIEYQQPQKCIRDQRILQPEMQ